MVVELGSNLLTIRSESEGVKRSSEEGGQSFLPMSSSRILSLGLVRFAIDDVNFYNVNMVIDFARGRKGG